MVALSARTGGSRHTGLAALPHENNHFKDCETLNAYFDYQKQHIKFGTAAEEKEILVSSIYQKFWRVKCKVKKNAIDKFDRKYGRITA